MATVVSSLSLNRDTELKSYLGLDTSDTSEDTYLDFLISAASEAADNYLNNPFTDDAGADIDIPDQVKLGVMKWILQEYQNRLPGVNFEKAGDLMIKYSTDTESPDEEIQERYWAPYRLLPGI